MQLRPASEDDAPAISVLIHRNLAQLTVDPSGTDAERFLEIVTPQALCGYITSPDFRYVVAMADEGLAGVVAIRNGTHLYHLFVQPERQNQGLGRQLWAHARQALVSATATELTVNSSASGVSVYEAFGFVVCGERVEQNGVAFVPMRLMINP